MKYGIEVHFQRVENNTLVLVSKRRFSAYAPDANCARVFAKAWADGEGLRVISINVFNVGAFPY